MPKIRKKRTSGARPAGGGPFLLSTMANTTMSSTAVAKNSLKKAETFVI